MDVTDFIGQQYVALRAEIIERQARRFRIMIAGLFGIPAIVLLGRYVEKTEDIGEVFLLIAPIIILNACFVYISENNGIIRVGRYIRKEIEPKFPNVVGWETWLEERFEEGTRSVDVYLNVCVLIVSILYYCGSIIIFIRYSDPILDIQYINPVIVGIFIVLGAGFLYVAFRKARYSTTDSRHRVGAPRPNAKP